MRRPAIRGHEASAEECIAHQIAVVLEISSKKAVLAPALGPQDAGGDGRGLHAGLGCGESQVGCSAEGLTWIDLSKVKSCPKNGKKNLFMCC